MAFLLSLSFCLSIQVCVCVCLVFSLPGSSVSFYCLNLSPLPDHLSINLLREPPLCPCPFTIFPISIAPTYLGLSQPHSPPFPCSPISFSLRGLFLFICLRIMPSYFLFAPLDLLLYLLSPPPSLAPICLAHLFLAFSNQLVSVAFLSLSPCYISVYLSHVSMTLSWHLISLCSH